MSFFNKKCLSVKVAITVLFVKVLGLSDICVDMTCYVCVSLSSYFRETESCPKVYIQS